MVETQIPLVWTQGFLVYCSRGSLSWMKVVLGRGLQAASSSIPFQICWVGSCGLFWAGAAQAASDVCAHVRAGPSVQ